jgi:hypothetical protein
MTPKKDTNEKNKIAEVPQLVCEKFLIELKEVVPNDVIDNLKKVLIEDKNLSEAAIKGSLLSVDQEND